MNKAVIIIVCLCAFQISCKDQTKTDESLGTVKTITSKYACVPPVTDIEWYQKDNIAPLLNGYDAIAFPITTKDTLVQRYFNQGLALAYAFNHAEAARSFYYATKLDPNCAMAFWGFAYVLGPNYNGGMEPDNYQRAFKAIQKAKELSIDATEKEKAIINAMAERYEQEPSDDRSNLDLAYSYAMKGVSARYPDDADINAMYAESLMDLHPWDLYEKNGEPRPWTPEIETLLENSMRAYPKHPGAHHFYIHAVEASKTPERAYASAKLFDDGLVSGAGHLIHMPSHIYIRTGDYHKGTIANINAVKVDSAYVTTCHAQGTYPLALYPHNYHFMAATATLEGNSHWAMLGANKTSELIFPEIMQQPGWGTLQHYYTIPYYVAVKFRKWDAILNLDLNTFDLKYPKAIRHYAEGMAHLGKGNIKNAKAELTQIKKLATDTSLKEITIWEINSVYELVQIADKVLESEILAKEKNYKESIKLLKEAIVIEDALNYNEPPDWFFSVRHHLGAVQIQAKQYENAISTYNEDLKYFPKNGWAHHGLKAAYSALNDSENILKMDVLLKESWKTADFKLE